MNRNKKSAEINMEKAVKEAKKFVKLKQKKRAVFALRRKKLYEDQLDKILDRVQYLEQ